MMLQLNVCESSVGVSMVFFGEQFNERATIFSEMSDEDLTLVPSHNLDCERDLAIAGIHFENTSKCSNRHFKAQCTRDKVMLHKSSQVKRINRYIILTSSCKM